VRSSDLWSRRKDRNLEKTGRSERRRAFTTSVAAPDGWYTVAGPAVQQPGRVRYNDDRNLLESNYPVERLDSLSGRMERTTFELMDTSTKWDDGLRESQSKRATARSSAAMGPVSGVRLSKVAPEMRPRTRNCHTGLRFGVWRWTKIFEGEIHCQFIFPRTR